jgi:hypothetical protein
MDNNYTVNESLQDTHLILVLDVWVIKEWEAAQHPFWLVLNPSRKGQSAGPYEWFLHDTEGAEPGKRFLTPSVRN